MIFVLNYTETDNAHYFFTGQLYIEDDSIESIYIKLTEKHDLLVKKYNLKRNTDEYNSFDVKIGDHYVKLPDISDDMSILSFDDYIKSIEKETIKI